jgi:hypothetical protein
VVQRPPAIHAAVLEALELTAAGADYLRSRGPDPDAAFAYGFRSLDGTSAWRELESMLRESYLPAELAAAGWHRLPWGGRMPALALPYWHRGDVLTLRFRALAANAAHGERYRTLADVALVLPFQADALEDLDGAELHIVEGEINAYTLALYGLRAIGLAGASTWRPDWTALVARAGRLVAWYDADAAGAKGRAKLATALAEHMGRAWLRAHGRAVTLPDGDVNDGHRAGTLAARIRAEARHG